MSQKRARRARRASKRVQEEFLRSGLTQREYVARQTMRSPLFHLELRQAMGERHYSQFEKPELCDVVARVLVAHGVALEGLKISVGRNPHTGALVLQCDATPDAHQEALRRAEQRLASGAPSLTQETP